MSNRVLLDVNERLCQMVGYRREELIGRSTRMLYSTQEEFDHVGQEKYRQIHEHRTGAVEARWLRKDGEIIDVLLSYTPLDPADLSRGVAFTALDITARKRVEDELRNIFSLSLDMICIADSQTDRFTKVNPAFERILGYSEPELLSQPFMDFVHPDDVERAREVLEDKLHQGERLVHFENRFRCKDGSYRWLDWTAHPQPEQGLTYGIARDVTEQKRVEDALRFTQFAVDHLADGAVWLTEDARFCYMNDAACQLLGYSREELMQLTLCDIDPNLTENIWTDFWQQLKATKSVVSEAIHRTKNGRLFPVEIRANYVEFGGRAYDCSFARDITERKQAEEALRFTQFAIDHSADAAFWMTQDARFFYVNEAACRALGYSCDELLKKTVYDIDPTFTEKIWSDSWRTLKAKKSNILETVHQTRDGRAYPVEIRANYVEFGGREYDCAFARDITERKRAEEALRESEERFRTAFEAGAVAMALTAMDTTLLKVNPSFCRMLGFSESETRREILHRDHSSRRRRREPRREPAAGQRRDIRLPHRKTLHPKRRRRRLGRHEHGLGARRPGPAALLRHAHTGYHAVQAGGGGTARERGATPLPGGVRQRLDLGGGPERRLHVRQPAVPGDARIRAAGDRRKDAV